MSYHSNFRRKNGHAIFLDRDGTIIKDRINGPVLHQREVEFEEGALEGLLMMQHLNYHLIVITNQGGIGRGEYTLKQYQMVNRRMRRILFVKGIYLTEVYFCPHKKEDECRCRKPGTGMLETAAKKYGIDLGGSYLIGNSLRDIKTGKNGGVGINILVQSGRGHISDGCADVVPDYKAGSLEEAVNYVKPARFQYELSRHC